MEEWPMITKQMAWAPRDDEQYIGIDATQFPFKFTRRWFKHRNQMTFSTFLPKKFSHNKPVNMIQIGVFEGMDLVWDFQNFLGHPDSRVLAIDPWLKTTKLDQQYMEETYGRARHNLSKWRNKLKIARGMSDTVLKDALQGVTIADKFIKKGQWDLIVIDGDHRSPAVYTDACYSLELARVGGWLLFDDVRNQIKKKHHVQEGLDEFLADYGDRVRLAWFHRFCDCYEKVS